MVDIPSNLRTVFTGTVERRGDSYVVEIPTDEVTRGTISSDAVYRIALLSTSDSDRNRTTDSRTAAVEPEPEPTPPVSEGEERTVTVEAVGSEGDGIAKVERGYVIIVPDSAPGEEVSVEIERVTPTVAFAEIADEHTDEQTTSTSETANSETANSETANSEVSNSDTSNEDPPSA